MTPQQLKAARQKLGRSQVKMATLCGIALGTWIKWEVGAQKPPAIALQHIGCLMWLDETGKLDAWQKFKQLTKRAGCAN